MERKVNLKYIPINAHKCISIAIFVLHFMNTVGHHTANILHHISANDRHVIPSFELQTELTSANN